MDIQKLIDDSNVISVKLYLQRQQLEAQKQQVNQAISNTEIAMVKLDGKLEVLSSLLEEQKKLADKKEPNE